VQATWEIVQNALCVAWIETTSFLSKVWTGFTSGFMKAWNTAINWTSKRMLELQGMFDSSLDVDAAKKMADQDLAATNKQIDDQTGAALAAREQQRAGERKAAEQMHNDEMAKIGQDANDKEKALDDEYNQKMQASQEELDKTRQEWKDAIGQAKKERKAKEAQGPERLEAPSAIPDYLEGLGPTIDQAQKKTIGVHGTFSAAEARRMGAGGANDRLTQASETTAKNSKKIVDLLRDNQGEFD